MFRLPVPKAGGPTAEDGTDARERRNHGRHALDGIRLVWADPPGCNHCERSAGEKRAVGGIPNSLLSQGWGSAECAEDTPRMDPSARPSRSGRLGARWPRPSSSLAGTGLVIHLSTVCFQSQLQPERGFQAGKRRINEACDASDGGQGIGSGIGTVTMEQPSQQFFQSIPNAR